MSDFAFGFFFVFVLFFFFFFQVSPFIYVIPPLKSRSSLSHTQSFSVVTTNTFLLFPPRVLLFWHHPLFLVYSESGVLVQLGYVFSLETLYVGPGEEYMA